jgi:endonuclease/exonuclease/phosphatase family metal-dependent hydrolase
LAAATGLPSVAARRGRSVAVIGREPFEGVRWIRPRWSQHAFVDLKLPSSALHIVGVHLSAVHAAWTERRRVHELRSLLAAIAGNVSPKHVVIGDFNTLAPGEALDFAKLPRRLRLLVWMSGGKVRWQTIAIMLGAGYLDCFRQIEPTAPGHTFPTWEPHVRLDYAFVPAASAPALRRVAVVSEGPVAQASDHFPLLVELADDPDVPTAPATSTA